jgi:transposase-like protein
MCRRVREQHRPIVDVAADFGVSARTVYRWLKRLLQQPTTAQRLQPLDTRQPQRLTNVRGINV